jgi:hypothetical protein
MQTFPWIILPALLAVAVGALVVWAFRPRGNLAPAPLPKDWALTARPVFNTDERRVYRLLREALPHHIVLSKLPLVRFCQPIDSNEVRYWYELLGTNHVAFAVCSANGRVLAAVDIDAERGLSRRVTQIKQAVLAACRVRYLRCPADRLPTIAELQLLVPQHSNTARGPQPAPAPSHSLHEARDSLTNAVAHRRAERTALWQDSTFFQDSFFALDSRLDNVGASEFGPATDPGDIGGHAGAGPDSEQRAEGPGRTGLDEGLGGRVVESPRPSSPTRH